MSYFDDYIADGLCCNVCGAYIDGDEPGYPRINGQKELEKIKKELEKNKINYYIKNANTGHFHTRRKFDNQLIEFYAFTGKISIVGKIQKARGIKSLIKILIEKEK